MALILRLAAAVWLAVWCASAVSARPGALARVCPAPQQDTPQLPFDAWLVALRAEALARGITPRIVDEALKTVERLPVVVERDRTQAELTLTLDQYLRRRLTAAVVRAARDAARRHQAVLKKVSAAYGVPAPFIVAIWGLESNFGRFTGSRPTIASLATLSYDTRRAAMFREEIFAALQILDRGDVSLAALQGSWAGAMGQVQFMPSSYLKYAVDFNGDGRRDIWESVPDVFGSIANYLKEHGWVRDLRWGREVAIDDATAPRVAAAVPLRLTGACLAVREMTEARPLTAWRALGVRQKGGSALPESDVRASLVRVDTHTFLAYANYEAILGYNCAHTYALSVAMLAERIGSK